MQFLTILTNILPVSVAFAAALELYNRRDSEYIDSAAKDIRTGGEYDVRDCVVVLAATRLERHMSQSLRDGVLA